MFDSSCDGLCAFVQRAQIATGAWLPGPSRNPVVGAFRVLRELPDLQTDRDRAVVASVLVRFGERLHAPPARGPWPCHRRTDPVGYLVRMASEPELTLQDAAAGFAWSKWHLCRVVRTRTGLTFTDVLHVGRVYLAILALVNSTDSVKQIAARVGYRSTGELDRQFARWVHMSPTQMRRALDAAAQGAEL